VRPERSIGSSTSYFPMHQALERFRYICVGRRGCLCA
jgi:hypothetical protein